MRNECYIKHMEYTLRDMAALDKLPTLRDWQIIKWSELKRTRDNLEKLISPEDYARLKAKYSVV